MASNRDFPSSPSTAVKDVHREEGQIRPSQCQKSPKKNVIDKPLSSSLALLSPRNFSPSILTGTSIVNTYRKKRNGMTFSIRTHIRRVQNSPRLNIPLGPPTFLLLFPRILAKKLTLFQTS